MFRDEKYLKRHKHLQELIYKKGEEYMSREMSIENYILSMRSVKQLVKMMFSVNQRKLLKFSHQNTISTELSEKCISKEDEEEFVNVSKLVKCSEYRSRLEDAVEQLRDKKLTNLEMRILADIQGIDHIPGDAFKHRSVMLDNVVSAFSKMLRGGIKSTIIDSKSMIEREMTK